MKTVSKPPGSDTGLESPSFGQHYKSYVANPNASQGGQTFQLAATPAKSTTDDAPAEVSREKAAAVNHDDEISNPAPAPEPDIPLPESPPPQEACPEIENLEHALDQSRDHLARQSAHLQDALNDLMQALPDRFTGVSAALQHLVDQQQHLTELLTQALLRRQADQDTPPGASSPLAQEFLGPMLLLNPEVKAAWEGFRQAGEQAGAQGLTPEQDQGLAHLEGLLLTRQDLLNRPELRGLAPSEASLRDQALKGLQELQADIRQFREDLAAKTMKIDLYVPLFQEHSEVPYEIALALNKLTRQLTDPLRHFQGRYTEIRQKYIEPCLQAVPSGAESNLIDPRTS